MGERYPTRDPGISAVLSFLLPGLGQVYNGRISRGVVHWLVHLAGVAALLWLAWRWLTAPMGVASAAAVGPAGEASGAGGAVVGSATTASAAVRLDLWAGLAVAAAILLLNWGLSVSEAFRHARRSLARVAESSAGAGWQPWGGEEGAAAAEASPGAGQSGDIWRPAPRGGSASGAAASLASRGEGGTPASARPGGAAPAPGPFARNLARIMEMENLDVAQVARLSGLDPNQVLGYLRGEEPDDAALRRLAFGLNVSEDLLRARG